MMGTNMATILNFRTQTNRLSMTGLSGRSGADAEIVIFPGIRIERYEDGPPSANLRPLEDDDEDDILEACELQDA